MNNRVLFLLISVFSFMYLFSVASAANIPLNLVGTVDGTCESHVNVYVYGYCPGQVGNASCSVDNASGVATAGGTYGLALTYDNAVYPAGIDVLIVASNSSCSTAAIGNNTLTNAVGGGGPVTGNVNITNTFTLSTPANGSTVNNQTINFTWVNNIVTPNSTLQIDNNSDFSSIDFSRGNIFTPNITANTSLLDDRYYWRVLTYIGSNLIQQSGEFWFDLVNSAPVITAISPSNSTWISATSTSLNLTTDLPANCAYSTSSGSFASKTAFSSTGAYAHSTTVSLASNGANTIYLQCNGTNGVLASETSTILRRDTTDPSAASATVSVDGGATYTTNSTINISWSGFSESVSSITGYYVNTTNNQGTSSGSLTASTSSLLTGLSDGVITAYVWAVDAAGNIGLAASDSITIDTTAPSFGSWSTSPVNINMFTTADVIVYVTISDTSSLSNLPQLRYRIGNDAFTTAANMTLVAGSVYSFTIPNQASPDDWANRAGENLTYIVNATDARGFSASANQTKYINDAFTAPVFSALSSQTIAQSVNTSIQLSSYDADGDTLTYYSNVSAMNIVQINASDSYAYWEPDNDDVGINIVTFTVTDGYFNDTQAVIVNVTNSNDAPSFSTISDMTAYEYVEFSDSINATDPDGDTLTYSSNASLFVISSSGEILFTPTAAQRGEQEIEFTVSDGNGGTDTENATFTVLYCGDNVCSSSYEDVDSCSLDCENDETSQGFIIESKTCLGEVLSIKAVELVPRTTCSTKGIIINGWESCDNLSSETVNIEQDISNSYVEIASLITDDYGVTSFRPNETGDYRIRYDGTDYDENIMYFSVGDCLNEQDSESSSSTSTSDEDEEPEVNLPFFEEPLSDEQIVRLSTASKLLYFLLLPFLLVLIIVAGFTTYYRYDKTKGKGDFSKSFDDSVVKLKKDFNEKTKPLKNAKWYKQLVLFFADVQKVFVKAKNESLKKVEPYIKTKEISVPFHAELLGSLDENKLVLQSLFDFSFGSKNASNFMSALQQEPLYQDKNLRIFALNASKLGLKPTYLFSATVDKDELLLLHENMQVKKAYPTLTDIKSELLRGHVVVVSLNMHALNKAAPDKNFYAILSGYSPDGFYMTEYSFARQKKTFVPTGVLQQAWGKSGHIECFIIKK